MNPPLFGLVLSGGFSTRMGRDKGSIVYHDVDQRSHCYRLLQDFCGDVFVSIRKEQENLLLPGQKAVFDTSFEIGPAAGLLAAHEKNPTAAWLVLACDMPGVTSTEIKLLVSRRNPAKAATSYVVAGIEPFFAIWEPQALAHLKSEALCGRTSPRHALKSLSCKLISGDARVLRNVNGSLLIS
jgi:molybdenum cofactor guanylyltransferase